jgi:hypothetical protein
MDGARARKPGDLQKPGPARLGSLAWLLEFPCSAQPKLPCPGPKRSTDLLSLSKSIVYSKIAGQAGASGALAKHYASLITYVAFIVLTAIAIECRHCAGCNWQTAGICRAHARLSPVWYFRGRPSVLTTATSFAAPKGVILKTKSASEV